jgi:tRNA-binding protein
MSVQNLSDFESLAIRVGTVVRCEPNSAARKPSLALWIDLGALGIRKSSAQIADLYAPDDLVGTQVVAVTNLEPIRVGGFLSEVLVIGALTEDGVVLLRPDQRVDSGSEVA